MLDAYALSSRQRAAATQVGAFAAEIVPIEVQTSEGPVMHVTDEGIRYDATMESIGSVKTLMPEGVVTAANASQIYDAASGTLRIAPGCVSRISTSMR